MPSSDRSWLLDTDFIKGPVRWRGSACDCGKERSLMCRTHSDPLSLTSDMAGGMHITLLHGKGITVGNCFRYCLFHA